MENIQVCVRMKPQIRDDEIQNPCWIIESNNLISIKNKEIYSYDQVFDSDISNAELFKLSIKDNLPNLFAGINLSVFVYGQTSTGKTFTMKGNEQCPGLIPTSVKEVFTYLNQEIKENVKSEIKVSYMELYNESLNDLLDGKKKNLDIRESQQKGIFVEGLTEVTVDSAEKALYYFSQGDNLKMMAETKLNENSSRSHTIFRIIVETTKIIDGKKTVYFSQLNLVDLAGSENVSKAKTDGIRMKEGTNINKSLLALSMVIYKLSSNQKQFVNFRDSKLTRLLQSSLSGNSRTTIICTVTQSSLSYQESVNTLNFGSKAKSIKTTIKINEIKDEKAKILEENNILKNKIKLLEGMHSDRDNNKKDVTMILDDPPQNPNSDVNMKHQNELLNTLEKEVSYLKKILLNKNGEPENQQTIKEENQNNYCLATNQISNKKRKITENNELQNSLYKRGMIEKNLMGHFNAISDFNCPISSKKNLSTSFFGENFMNDLDFQNSNNDYYSQQLLMENEELRKNFYEMRNNFLENLKSKDAIIKNLNYNQNMIIEKCEKLISENEENYVKLQSEYEKSKEEIIEKEEENKNLQNKLQENETEFQNLNKEIESLKEEIIRLKANKDKETPIDDTVSIEITKQIDRLNLILNQEQEKNKELSKLNENLSEEKKQFKLEKDNLNAEIWNFKSKLELLERNNENLINESNKNKQDVSSYKNELLILKDKINAQKSEHSQSKIQIEKLQSEIIKVTNENKNNESLNSSLFKKLEEANNKIAKYEKGAFNEQRMNELENKITEQNSQMFQLQSSLNDSKEKLKRIEEIEIKNYEKIIQESFDKISELQKGTSILQEKNKYLENILKITEESKNVTPNQITISPDIDTPIENNDNQKENDEFISKKRKKLKKVYQTILESEIIGNNGRRMRSLLNKQNF